MSLIKPLLVVICSSLLAIFTAWVVTTKILPEKASIFIDKGVINKEPKSTEPNQPIKPSQKIKPSEKVITLNADKLYALINAYRKENQLSPLRVQPTLEKSATAKNTDMVENQYWRHQDKQLLNSWYLIEQAGYHYQKVGENLAFAATSEWQVFQDWVKSPTHRKQLLEPSYEDMGLAFDCQAYSEYAGGGCLVTLHLAKPSVE